MYTSAIGFTINGKELNFKDCVRDDAHDFVETKFTKVRFPLFCLKAYMTVRSEREDKRVEESPLEQETTIPFRK